MKKFSDFVFAIIVFGILGVAPAHAYLDGATVSLVLQAVAGAAASALLFGKLYLAKIRNFFVRSKNNTPD